jgi:hypothetical protein
MSSDLVEPPAASAEPPASALAAPPEPAPAAGDLSAREAVRRALGELGPDAEVEAVHAHLQSRFGLTPPRTTVQNYLNLARKDLRDGIPLEPRRRGRPRKPPANGTAPVPAALVEAVVEALEVLRDLCDRLGDDNVRRLLDTL